MLKLTVGTSRKIGQPNYGSLGASCAIECELDGRLLEEEDLAAVHRQARTAYAACAKAVHDELLRQRQEQGNDRSARRGSNGAPGRTPSGVNGPGRGRPATPAQARAIRRLAGKTGFDLGALLAEEFDVSAVEDLTVVQASHLIGDLQGAADRRQRG